MVHVSLIMHTCIAMYILKKIAQLFILSCLERKLLGHSDLGFFEVVPPVTSWFMTHFCDGHIRINQSCVVLPELVLSNLRGKKGGWLLQAHQNYHISWRKQRWVLSLVFCFLNLFRTPQWRSYFWPCLGCSVSHTTLFFAGITKTSFVGGLD